MKTSIATVSLSGGLDEKLEAIAARRLRGRRDFRERSPVVQRHAGATCGGWSRISAWRSSRSSRSAISRACRAAARARAFARAERKFDLMQELGCDLLMVCCNVSPDSARRHRPRRGRSPRAWRARRQARPARRLRGAGLGPPHQRLPRRLGGRCAAPTIPAIGLVLDSFHILARKTDLGADPRHPARPHLPGAARRRADARHGLPVVEPALPQLPRPGRPAAGRLHGGAGGHRLRRPAVAGNLQRPVPRRLGAQRRDRRPALAHLPARPVARPRTGAPPAVAAAAAAAREVPRTSSSSSSPSTRTARAAGDAVCRPRLPHGRRAQVQGGDALVARAPSTSCSTPRRTASPTPINITHGTGGLRHRPRGRRRGRHARRAPRRCSTSRSARPSGRASWKSRPCAASAAASSISSTARASSAACGTSISTPPARPRRKASRPHRVDHISQSMHYEEMLSWLLFYTSLLDLDEDAGSRTLLDPGGLVQEPGRADRRTARCASCSTPRSRQRTLVVALPDASSSARACSTSPSPPTTSSPPSTQLEANGVDLLPIPENYYDDLEAQDRSRPPSRSTRCRRTTSSTTATATANTSRPTPSTFESASSSRSSSGAATTASAPPTRRSGWPRRRGWEPSRAAGCLKSYADRGPGRRSTATHAAAAERGPPGPPHVILSAAKDLMPAASGDEVLRCRSGRQL